MQHTRNVVVSIIIFGISANCIDLGPDETFQLLATNQGMRYRLSKDPKSFTESASICAQTGSILTEPRNQKTSLFLYKILQNSSMPWDRSKVNEGVWIGLKLKNTSHPRPVYWISNSAQLNATNYTNWVTNEPNTPDAFCIQLWRAYKWQWDDTYCDLNKHFICQDKDPRTYTTKEAKQLVHRIVTLQYQGCCVDYKAVNQISSKLNDLLEVSADILDATSSHDVIVAVETVINQYNVSQGNLKIDQKNIGIEIKNLTCDARKDDSVVVVGENVKESKKASGAVLSSRLLLEAMTDYNLRNVQANIVLYKTSTLFVEHSDPSKISKFGEGPSRHMANDVISHVISLEVKGAKLKNLRNKVVTNHKVSLSSGSNSTYGRYALSGERKVLKPTIKCVFWDPSNIVWSDEGCTVEGKEEVTHEQSLITCSCNHMTHFAVILSLDEYYHPPYLTYLTITGCAVSIACLLATIVTYLYFKHLRSKLPQQILIHLCFSLVLLNSSFLIGIERTHLPVFCFVITTILHYAVLLSWAWMLAESVLLFRTLVLAKTGSGDEKTFIYVACVLCYVLPAAFVATLANVTDRNLYQSERYCWIAMDSLLYSVVIPVALILLINFVIFFTIMYNITFRSKVFRQHVNLHRISMAGRRAMCMIFVLGLPWVFGFAMLLTKDDESNFVFSLLFTVFNSLQGLFLFVLFCVRQESVRNAWGKPLGRRYRNTFKLARKFDSPDPNLENNKTNKDTNNRSATIQTILSTPHMEQIEQTSPSVTRKPLPPPQFVKPIPFRHGWS